MPWPKTVPILSGRDICKGQLHGPKNTHCLRGWKDKVFGFTKRPDKVDKLLAEECGTEAIGYFNDRPDISKATLARLWNRVMGRLGYRVGNPEAK